MAACKWCGRTGWFLTTSKNGLCSKCKTTVQAKVEYLTRAVNESLAVVNREDESLDMRLKGCQAAVKYLREMVPLNEKGVVELKIPPQEWVARIYMQERKLVRTHIKDLYQYTVEILPEKENPTERADRLQYVLSQVEQYKTHLGEANAMVWNRRIEEKLSAVLVERAEKAHDVGQKTVAIDQYLEALDMLRTDDAGNPAITSRMNTIKKRIRELGGEIPKNWERKEGTL